MCDNKNIKRERGEGPNLYRWMKIRCNHKKKTPRKMTFFFLHKPNGTHKTKIWNWHTHTTHNTHTRTHMYTKLLLLGWDHFHHPDACPAPPGSGGWLSTWLVSSPARPPNLCEKVIRSPQEDSKNAQQKSKNLSIWQQSLNPVNRVSINWVKSTYPWSTCKINILSQFL